MTPECLLASPDTLRTDPSRTRRPRRPPRSCQALLYCSQRCRSRDARTHAASGECHLLRSRAAAAALGPWVRDAALALRLLARRRGGGDATPLARPDDSEFGGPDGREVLRLAREAARHAAAAAAAAAASAGGDKGSDADEAPPPPPSEEEAYDAVLAAVVNSIEVNSSHPGDAGSAPRCPPLAVYGCGARARVWGPAAWWAAHRSLGPGAPCPSHRRAPSWGPAARRSGPRLASISGAARATPLPPSLPRRRAPPSAVCRLNHSCRPNAAFHVLPGGGKARVRLLRHAPPGAEVTVSYLDAVAAGAEERREQLSARWGPRLRRARVC
jgi:hypothetical protein